MNERYFNVGEYVRIIYPGKRYSSYDEWAIKYGLNKFLYEEALDHTSKFKIIKVEPHTLTRELIYGIEDVYTGQQYIFQSTGLRRVKKFEVGDDVIRIGGYHPKIRLGSTGRITSMSYEDMGIGDEDGYSSLYFEHYKRKIMTQTFNGVDAFGNPKNMTVEDLKPFMRVLTPKGRYIVTGRTRNKGTSAEGANLQDWSHLTFEKHLAGYTQAPTVLQIYEAPDAAVHYLDETKFGKLIWKAKPQETEQEKAIRELEENIKASQEKLDKLKETL